ncbi:tandem-95 repeat protein (plasmid) [Aminobacter sp. BA135]|uniref:Ig-like domain-containing protein n=1 Tax=Aminobacter sp. BA135 TaxID=537596 RepID=UPI003D7AA926
MTGGLTQLFTVGGDFGSDGPGNVTSSLSFTGIPDTGLATNLSRPTAARSRCSWKAARLSAATPTTTWCSRSPSLARAGSEQLQTTLYEALDHGQDSNQFDSSQILALTQGNKIELQYEVTRTDGDGDSITQTATVQLADSQGSGFVFDDDGPKLVGRAQLVATVDEDGLGNSQSTGNADDGKTGEVTGTNLAVATGNAGALLSLVDFGQDGPHPTKAFGLVTQATPVDSGFNSKGGDVVIVSDGTTLTGYVNVGGGAGFDAGTDRAVFTLVVGGDGSYVFTLIDQIDHPALTGQPGDDAENLLTNSGIDLSSFVVAMDGDGDTIGLGAGSFQVQVLDDIPTIVARDAGSTTTTTTETIVYTLQAGNTDVRGMDGTGNHDIKLSGIDINEGDNSVNTTGTKIGVGDGQIIDGYETHPKTTGPEILTMDFVNNLSITPNNPNPPIVTDGGSYDVSSVTFSIDVAEAKGIESAVLFIGAKDGGAFEAVTVKINGVSVVGTPVFEGGVQVGYAFGNVPDGATVEVTGNTPFDQLRVGNYNDFTFDSTAGGTDTTLTGGNPFKIYGIEAKVTITTTVTEVFRVSHDESAGVNTGSDPNPANDVALIPHPALIDGAFGYAKSSASVLTLFQDVSVGADDDATYAYAITDANGNALSNVDSGLKSLDGTAIMLSTDGNGVLVGTAGGETVFKVYVDGDGAVWIAQYKPIAHAIDGSSAAAFDDIATIAAELHVKATITDFDGDSTSAVSDVALAIDFQDDGPVAHNDQNSVTEDGPVSASGNVVTDAPGADATGTDGFGSIAWDGAAGTVVAGTYGQLTVGVDGSYTYTLYTQAQNPAGYTAVQGLSANETLAESFDYTLTDGDGDSSPATLTITINGADDGVTIGGLTPSAEGGDAVVDEKGLPPRSGEPAGSGEASPNPNDNSDTSETTTGNFNFTSPDGLQSLTIAGTVISYAQLAASGSTPITIAGGPAYGTLIINGFTGSQAGGTVQYRFTLTDNLTSHTDNALSGVDGDSDRGAADQLFADYAISVTDTDGSSAPGTLSIAINDDGPTANNDVATQGAENQAFTIDAFANDVFGADGVDIDNNPAVAVTFTQPTQGVVTYDPTTGLFTYTPNAGAGSSSTADSFTYTIKDGDGDVSTATVSLTLAADSTPTVTVTDGTVDEKGLVNGSGEVANPAPDTDNSETTTGTFTVATGSDGLAKLEIQDKDGVWQNVTGGGTVQGANGVLTVTNTAGTYSWSYTLSNNLLSHDDNALSGVDGDSDRGAADQKPGDNFQVRVEDSDGDVSAPDTLTITVNDDGPTANNDVATQGAENQAFTIDAFANDVFGADGVDIDNNPAVAVTFTQPTQGVVTYDPTTGLFTYTPNAGAGSSSTADSFTYTIKDGDGDVSTATVSLTLAADSTPTVTVTDGTVDEKGLVNGSGEVANPAPDTDNSETTTGTFTVATGSDGLAKLEIQDKDGVWQNVTGGGTVQGANGVLTVTNTAGTYSWSYTLSNNLLSHDDNALSGVDGDSDRGAADQKPGDNFQVRVEDSDGDVSAPDTLTITVNDDGPTANNDVATQGAENQAFTIDAFANDVFGADGVDIDNNPAVAVTFTQPTQGVVTYDPTTGLFTYTPNAGAGSSSTADSFTYTIKDGDGDVSTATVSLTLAADSTPTVTVTDGTVDEKGLVNGSGEVANPAPDTDNSETTTGTFTVATGSDGLAKLEIQDKDGVWQNVTGGGTVQGANGVLTVTNTAGTYSWSYTLSNNLLSHDDNALSGVDGDSDRGAADQKPGDNFQVRVEDSDGDVSAPDTLTITVNDDGPTANNDVATQGAENQAFTIDAFANDVFGADGVDIDNNPAVAVTFTQPTQGVVTYDPTTGLFTYTPNAGAGSSSTADSFTYTIKDGDGDVSTATVSLTLAADSTPTVTVTDGTVDEKGLVNGSGEVANPAPDTDNSETTTGTFTVATGSDGLAKLEIQDKDGVWQNVTGGGTVQGANGVLTVTNTAGTYSWSYTLSNNLLSHDDNALSGVDGDSDRGAADQKPGDNFQVRVEDSDGDVSAPDTLTITVNDDGPTANNDVATQGAENQAFTIDAFANDVFGADGVDIDNNPAVAVTFTQPTQGVVTYDPTTGLFTYTPNAGAGSSSTADSFTYTIKDGDGDVSTATVSLTLAADSTPTVTVTDGTVDEKGLVNGSGEVANPAPDTDNSETTTGTFTVATGSDGLAKLEIQDKDGVWQNVTGGGTVQGANGVLTVTNTAGTYSWSYTLSNNLLSHDDNALSGVDGDSDRGAADQKPGDNFQVRVEDSDGDVSAPDTLTITVNDDGPTANNDVATQGAENQAFTIDAFANDVFGADGVDIDNNPAVAVTFTQPTQGVVTYDPTTGLFTYTPNAGAGSSSTADSFTYTIKDGDGDVSTATVSLTLAADSTPTVTVTDGTVDEKGLVNGSGEVANPAPDTDNSETTTGTFTVATGSDGLAKLEIQDKDGVWQNVTGGGTVQGANGVLTVTNTAGTYSWSYTLSNNLLSHDDNALSGVDGDSDRGAADQKPGDNFQVRVEDSDGDVSAPDTLTITVNDDGPTANNDVATQGAENQAFTIDAFANDVFGADGVDIDNNPAVAVTFTQPTQGVVTYDPTNGLFTYTPNAGAGSSSTADSFTYTIKDGDGDVSTATVSLTLAADSTPTVSSAANLVVDEDGFANAAVDTSTTRADETDSTESLTQSGTAVVNFGSDVPANLAASIALVDTAGLDGQLQTLAGNAVNFGLESGALVGRDSVTNAEVIRIAVTGAVAGPGAGDVTYSYSTTLSQPIKHTAGGIENSAVLTGVTFQATDKDGDPVQGTFSVTVVDDVPQANATTAATVLDDEAQPGGITANEAPGDVDAPEAAKVATGTLNITPGADGLASVAFSATVTAAGEAGPVSPLQAIYVDPVTKLPTLETISTSWTSDGAGGGTLTGTSVHFPAGSPAFTLKVEADGDYTFTLNAPLSHPLSDDVGGSVLTAYEDNLVLTFNYTATDRDGDTTNSTLTITVDDDTPDAVNDTAVVDEGTIPSVNIVLVIDTSGSMDDDDLDPGPGVLTRLDLAKAAALNLLNSPGVNINQVMVVEFYNGTTVNTPIWGNWSNAADKADIESFINSRVAGGGTSYDAATAAVRANWGTGPSEADFTNVYFLSDGNPDPNSAGLDATEQGVWESFLVNPDNNAATNDAIDNVYAVGIGNGITTGPLEPISWSNGNANFPPIIITEATQLSQTLTNTLPSAVTGNVLANDGVPASAFGADGGFIKTIVVDGVTYTYNPANGTITASASDPGLISNTGTQIKIQTDLGGVFVFNFANNGSNQAGAWGYTAPTGVTSDKHELFTYTLVDGDGDGDSATLDITVQNVNKVPTGGSVAAQLDDEGLSGGNAGGTGDIVVPAQSDNNEATFSGTLTGTGGDGALTYSFSNLNTTTQAVGTETVQYGWNATTNMLTATIAGGARAGQTLFTVALNPATGAYDLVLLKPVMHATGGNEQSIVVNLDYKVADSDADVSATDTGTGQLAITFNDDTPEGFSAQSMRIENITNATGSGALNFFESIGADGGSVVFTGTNNSNLQTTGSTNITSGGVQVKLYGFGTDMLVAKTGADAAGNGGTTVFTVKLSPNASVEAQDAYTVKFFKPLDDGSGQTINPSNYTDNSSQNYKVFNGANDRDVIISADNAGSAARVNGSNNGGLYTDFGVGSGTTIASGEKLRFDFATGAGVSGGGNNSISPASLNHYLVNGFTFTLQNSGTSTLLITAIDADNDTTFTDDTTTVPVFEVYKNGVLTSYTVSGGGILVSGVNGDVFAIVGANGYDRIEVGYSSGANFTVANVGFTEFNVGNPLAMNFNVTATDADGDTAAGTIGITTAPLSGTVAGTSSGETIVAGSGSDTINAGSGDDWLIGGSGADTLNGEGGTDTAVYRDSAAGVTVTVNGSGIGGDAQGDTLSGIENLMGSNFADTLTGDGSANILYGLDGDDILSGAGGADILDGGSGADRMTGGSGGDTFVISADAIGAINDVITDFNPGQGDQIDLSELLSGIAPGTNLETSGYVSIVQNGANAELQVDVDGGGNNFQTVAVLENYTAVNEAVKVLFEDNAGTKHQDNI